MDGYKFLGFPSENTMRLVRTDSTNRIRKDATASRKMAEFQPSTKVFSVPEITMVYRQDVPDVDGNPTGQRAMGSYTFRLPVGASEAQIDQLLADFRADVTAADFRDRLINQTFPIVAAEAQA